MSDHRNVRIGLADAHRAGVQIESGFAECIDASLRHLFPPILQSLDFRPRPRPQLALQPAPQRFDEEGGEKRFLSPLRRVGRVRYDAIGGSHLWHGCFLSEPAVSPTFAESLREAAGSVYGICRLAALLRAIRGIRKNRRYSFSLAHRVD